MASTAEPPRRVLDVHLLEVRGQIFPVRVAFGDNLYVARFASKRFNATGQGKTEEEALEDIRAAIELLLEEEEHPTNEDTWPRDFQ